MLDYGALPPEINSGRMYAGPGSAPLTAAAAAWRGLAVELATAATSYEQVISRLAGQEWLGPASASMDAAATPYVRWMNTTAAQAEQAGSQATAAATAFESAYAATVPPAVVAANRAQHAALVATNFLGQNTAAIAATDAHYFEMWAQDAAAMYSYAGSSAAAARVSPFTEPNQTTNPAGTVNQAAAIAQAGGSAAGNAAQTAQLISSVPNAIGSLSSPAAAATTAASGSQSWIEQLISVLNNNPLNGFAYLVGNPMYNFSNTMGTGAAFIPSSLLPSLVGYLTHAGMTAAGGGGLGGLLGPGGPLSALGGLGGATSGMSSAFSMSAVSAATPGAVTAGMGQASLVGSSLSAPATWVSATSATSANAANAANAASALPVTAQPTGWAVAPESHSMATMPPGIPAGGGRGGFAYGAPRYGFRPKVMVRPMVC